MSSDLIIEIVSIVMVTLSGIVVSYLKEYLKSKADHTKSNTLQKYLIIAENLVETAVMHLNQTTVKALKEANADGKLTREEAVTAFNTALGNVKKALGPQIIGILSENMGSVEEWLSQEVEKYVVINKSDNFKTTLIANYDSDE